MARSGSKLNATNPLLYPPDIFFETVEKDKIKNGSEAHRRAVVRLYISNAIKQVNVFPDILKDSVRYICTQHKEYLECVKSILLKAIETTETSFDILWELSEQIEKSLLNIEEPECVVVPTKLALLPKIDEAQEALEYLQKIDFEAAFLSINKVLLKKPDEQQAVIRKSYLAALNEAILKLTKGDLAPEFRELKIIQEEMMNVVLILNRDPARAYREFEAIIKRQPDTATRIELRRIFIALASLLDPPQQAIVLRLVSSATSTFSTSSNANLLVLGSFASKKQEKEEKKKEVEPETVYQSAAARSRCLLA